MVGATTARDPAGFMVPFTKIPLRFKTCFFQDFWDAERQTWRGTWNPCILGSLYNRSLAGILGYRAPFSPRDPAHVHHLRAAIVLFSAFLRTWRAVGRGIFPLFHLTIVLASLLVHVWMAARSVTVTGTTSRPLPTSSSTCRTGGTLSRIPRAGVLYWDDIDNGTLSIEFSMLLFCPPATSRAAPEIFMCHY